MCEMNFRVSERSSNGAGSSLIIVLRMRLRSRTLWKHDLETAEIGLCCANDRFFLSKVSRINRREYNIVCLLGR